MTDKKPISGSVFMVRHGSAIVITGERVNLVYKLNFFFTSTYILCTEPIMKGVACQCTI